MQFKMCVMPCVLSWRPRHRPSTESPRNVGRVGIRKCEEMQHPLWLRPLALFGGFIVVKVVQPQIIRSTSIHVGHRLSVFRQRSSVTHTQISLH